MSVRVEVGSGWAPAEGFLHFDINPTSPDLHVLCDVQSLPLRSGSVDELRAVDILEHVTYRHTLDLLAEWARVLAPTGRMYVQTPDAQTMMQRFLTQPNQMVVDEFKAQPPIVSLAWRLLGGHADNERVSDGDDWRWNAHYALFSRDSLIWHLNAVGLDIESIRINPHPNLCCWAFKPGRPQ